MAKNIAAFLDGTWDTYKEGVGNNSNVGTMYGAAVNDGKRQVTHYTRGVGTDWYDKIKGGAFGVGLNDRIRDAYQFITDNYDDGDAIFIFGFSRGAYEARSLGGMIDRVGLLDRKRFAETNRRDMFDIVFNNYTRPKDDANNKLVANFKATNCVDAPIKMIGVWDTVGALGVPLFATTTSLFVPKFHDLSLGPRVENAYHAMAHRRGALRFPADVLGSVHRPSGTAPRAGLLRRRPLRHRRRLRRRPRLADITLCWMASRAQKARLLFTDDSFGTKCADDAPYGTLHDSFSALYEGRGRFYRVVDPGMTLHKSVQARLTRRGEPRRSPASTRRRISTRDTTYDFVE